MSYKQKRNRKKTEKISVFFSALKADIFEELLYSCRLSIRNVVAIVKFICDTAEVSTEYELTPPAHVHKRRQPTVLLQNRIMEFNFVIRYKNSR